MTTQLAASHRLQAMKIMKGNNYKEGHLDAEQMMSEDALNFKVLQSHGNQMLLKVPMDRLVNYVLVTLAPDFDVKKFKKHAREGDNLEDAGVDSIEAFISMSRKGEVDGLWVEKKLRGKGYGKALYTVAHNYTPKGIVSSDDLGEMSLGTWLSLYKSNPAIRIDVKGTGVVPRKHITVEGLTVYWKGSDPALTSAEGPRFTFRWPK